MSRPQSAARTSGAVESGEPAGEHGFLATVLRTRGVTAAGLVLAILLVLVAAAWGIHGLAGNPVQGTDSAGVTTLQGSWEPYSCDLPGLQCIGYVQQGGRSVSVVLPPNCPVPARAQSLTVQGRLDPSLGSATYRATRCPNQ